MATTKDKKVMDVAKTEDAKVDIGSKPMIVGHKSMAADPMVREKAVENSKQQSTDDKIEEALKIQEKPAEAEIEPPSARQKTLEPLATEKPTESPDTEKIKPSATAEKSEEKDESADGEAKKIDPVAEAMEQEEKIRKIIDSKKYFVSIKQAKSSGRGLTWIFVGILLAALVAVFYMADTGRLDLGFELPFDLLAEK